MYAPQPYPSGRYSGGLPAPPARPLGALRPVRTGVATFAGGRFWDVEHAFRRVPGVVEVVAGYTGGHTASPTYRDVCTDRTGHAEAVRVVYDTARVSYAALVEVFFSLHDPTQCDRQGADEGTQYRSAVFVHSPAQRAVAERARRCLDESGRYAAPVVTEVTAAALFHPAEDQHQRYYEKNGLAG